MPDYENQDGDINKNGEEEEWGEERRREVECG